jgi:dTMP kinase
MNNQKFIVFEGIDGAGKTTQIELLCAALEKRGLRCKITAEPTDMPSGKEIRAALSGKTQKTALEMAEMFACDRAIHNTHPEEGINRALADGITVISDRYYYSSLAYQGAALGYDTVAALNLDNPDIRTPDLCVFLDLTPEKSLERIGKRGEATEIYENFDYLTRTRAMFFDVFERLCKKGENIAVIDASGSVDEIAARVLSAVEKIFD